MQGKDVSVGKVILVRYEYSARGDYADKSELLRVDGLAGDGCFELSNGDHLFWADGFGWGIDDMEVTPCSVS